ncbi:Detected protein of confused Function [Hibiscus syriacus]|uniref:Detected protein of confused Function n=1 Tax=Hibiscus syriacus TaxID=106335 RepID=A0A6A3AKQ2_HIBSY|nr:Detected protein of confused Function [Hibiscus syriacus]
MSASTLQLLLCLRVLIRKCVYENISKDNIQKVFPEEVLPEIQRLLTLLLQKFQREWQADIHMDKVSLPRLKAMTWNTATQDTEMMEPLAVLNLKLQNDAQAPQEELDLKFQLAKETLDTMLKSMYCIRDQLSNLVGAMAQLSILVPYLYLTCCTSDKSPSGHQSHIKGPPKDLGNAVKNEASKNPTQNGEIHPLTRYVMNYVKLLVDYSETLNLLLESQEDEADGQQSNDGELESGAPFAKRLLLLISSPESNLKEKSKLYEDGALHCIFLMNNTLCMVQKLKDSELGKLLGDYWVRMQRGQCQTRQYATSYLRACWIKALIQTGWKVPGPQLCEELRIPVSEKSNSSLPILHGEVRESARKWKERLSIYITREERVHRIRTSVTGMALPLCSSRTG